MNDTNKKLKIEKMVSLKNQKTKKSFQSVGVVINESQHYASKAKLNEI